MEDHIFGGADETIDDLSPLEDPVVRYARN